MLVTILILRRVLVLDARVDKCFLRLWPVTGSWLSLVGQTFICRWSGYGQLTLLERLSFWQAWLHNCIFWRLALGLTCRWLIILWRDLFSSSKTRLVCVKSFSNSISLSIQSASRRSLISCCALFICSFRRALKSGFFFPAVHTISITASLLCSDFFINSSREVISNFCHKIGTNPWYPLQLYSMNFYPSVWKLVYKMS